MQLGTKRLHLGMNAQQLNQVMGAACASAAAIVHDLQTVYCPARLWSFKRKQLTLVMRIGVRTLASAQQPFASGCLHRHGTSVIAPLQVHLAPAAFESAAGHESHCKVVGRQGQRGCTEEYGNIEGRLGVLEAHRSEQESMAPVGLEAVSRRGQAIPDVLWCHSSWLRWKRSWPQLHFT